MLIAFSNFYGVCSIAVAELRALRDGLKLCADIGLAGCQVSSDSATTVQFITHKACSLWNCCFLFQEVMDLVESLGVNICFTYRESNRAADFLANLACSRTENSVFRSGDVIPQELQRIMREDRAGLLVLRM
ncbi:uncharacterized protein LOC122663270 [Telopea speciosissima]|uniref:uncharacterized protein LOC122663270 n=1 Tax=Telopea speciosissima TaxID=54955 RepID=UPI001CC56B0E|nr:uncharacterized protein LOC122663270 [Telopea speciosissima]